LDNDFSRLFAGEILLAVETLNIDAASFRQMEEASAARRGSGTAGGAGEDGATGRAVAERVLETVAARGKQHNPVTGSGGMLLGRVLQVVSDGGAVRARPGDRVATLVSLSLTPLRVDGVRAVRRESAQMDVEGEAVLFESGGFAQMPADLSERLALALFDVAGAAPQAARLVDPGATVLVLGAGGKSGILCAAAARKRGARRVVGVESHAPYADDLRTTGLCDAVVVADARDPVAVRARVLEATGGAEVDVAFSCVNIADAEMSAILCTRERGAVYFFAMSTSFTKAALGAEGVGKDVDLYIGNGYAIGHAEETLALVRATPAVKELFSARYG
jgi:L-erythro-3,5-diaminohexanoate dehydrogenase